MIRVEVVYALPHRQQIIALDVEDNCSVLEAAQRSGIDRAFSAVDGPALDLTKAQFGIFSHPVEHPAQQLVRDGDRIEIYRPLLIDPKEVRKQRAEHKVRTGSRQRKKTTAS